MKLGLCSSYTPLRCGQGKLFFFLLARLHGVTTLKTTVQITSTVDFKPNDSPLSMITGYFVPVIKPRDGYKDVSLTF